MIHNLRVPRTTDIRIHPESASPFHPSLRLPRPEMTRFENIDPFTHSRPTLTIPAQNLSDVIPTLRSQIKITENADQRFTIATIRIHSLCDPPALYWLKSQFFCRPVSPSFLSFVLSLYLLVSSARTVRAPGKT